ncbi:hypothetical protein PCC9214_05453 (plasmid) [Planktothrix tepida]|uniref:Uncharacterized protein n=1 Tax=Planktothrix tepida PCC 9214 TaxID=671072 RepID=A0A1J1LN21_9CYAN|nr:prepilin-type N-terminal cleavage/methylation domain-containing protein [Planktothrix tepida]CAD5988742.1 hypothetical protein PCC9214_05453 [Planktothrix tepida]CUR33944.1 conserved hypothetical protein [Planktothrix tepida PCC 9214]
MKSESGKSLTELLVVIVIIGILSSISLPMFLNYLKLSRLVATIHQVKQYTTQSRYDALTDSGIKTVCILEGQITSTTDGNCHNKSIKSLPSGVSLDVTNSTFSNKAGSISGKGNDFYKISFSGNTNGGQLGRITFTTRTANEPLTNRNTMCLFQTLKNVDNLGYETNIDIRKGKDCQK